MKRAFRGLPTDEEGRFILRLGGPCKVCGREPEVKYSKDGNVVLHHLPEDCVGHTRGRKWQRSDARYEEGAA